MKKEIIKIVIALILFLVALIVPLQSQLINNGLFVISYLIVGLEIVLKAIRNIFKGKVFDENFLMAIATIGAFVIGEYPEAVAVMLFYQIGEAFQDYAVDKSRKSIISLMDIRPDFANIQRNGKIDKINPEEVNVGDIIVVKPGEKVPLDGIIVKGTSMIDTSALTGESVPKEIKEQDEILSGCINENGVLEVKVTKKFGESTASKILDLVENASSKKSKSENFISKFAKYYTPIVVVTAVLLAIIPPMIFNRAEWIEWIHRALTFLVVSCPCALVISIPLGFFGGIGGASKIGVLVKGSNYLEALSNTEIMVLDKTGTLTEGVFEVQQINPIDISKEDLIKYATYAESFSNHPIAISLKKAYGKEIVNKKVSETQELPGLGVRAVIEGESIFVGNEKLMKENCIDYIKSEEIGTILYIAVNNKFAGTIVISDKIKTDAKETIDKLKKDNIKKIVMLTGDKRKVGENVAKKLGIDEVYTELLPSDKVEKVEELMKNKSENGNLAFIGDGINDAPVLAISDIGIAMGGLGSDAAIEAADVVLMTDEPSRVVDAIKVSKKTMTIVKQNIIFAISIKLIVLILSAIGISNMWQAVFADVGVSILAILNALRALYIRR
ncbi:MAG: heavy metal translocating P-type ATPase [Clostridia bacterium]|nr:heavy metal translocating P-type ATPase [Clostridia bacterium]